MTLSQFGSASQDAMLISLSPLSSRQPRAFWPSQRLASTMEFALFAGVVLATTLARPSQIARLASSGTRIRVAVGPGLARQGNSGGRRGRVNCDWLWLLTGLIPRMPADQSYALQFAHIVAHPLIRPTAW